MNYSNQGEKVYDPHDLNQAVLEPKAIYGANSLKTAAKIFESVLKNETNQSQKQAVIINPAFAIQTAHPELDLEDHIKLAQESLEKGNIVNIFQKRRPDNRPNENSFSIPCKRKLISF